MKIKTDSFSATGNDGRIYTINIFTTMVEYQECYLPGSFEYLLSNGDELFNVPGFDNQWEIASTGVRITKV